MVFCQVLLEVNNWKHQNCFWTWSFSLAFRDRQLREMNRWLCPKSVNSKPALCDYDHLSTVYSYSEEIIYGKVFFNCFKTSIFNRQRRRMHGRQQTKDSHKRTIRTTAPLGSGVLPISLVLLWQWVSMLYNHSQTHSSLSYVKGVVGWCLSMHSEAWHSLCPVKHYWPKRTCVRSSQSFH